MDEFVSEYGSTIIATFVGGIAIGLITVMYNFGSVIVDSCLNGLM